LSSYLGSTFVYPRESVGAMEFRELEGRMIRCHVPPMSVDIRIPLDQLAIQTARPVSATS
jgi:hypothetical protein